MAGASILSDGWWLTMVGDVWQQPSDDDAALLYVIRCNYQKEKLSFGFNW